MKMRITKAHLSLTTYSTAGAAKSVRNTRKPNFKWLVGKRAVENQEIGTELSVTRAQYQKVERVIGYQMNSRIASRTGPFGDSKMLLQSTLARWVREMARSRGMDVVHIAKKRHALPSQLYKRG
jgi:hypothetical protein